MSWDDTDIDDGLTEKKAEKRYQIVDRIKQLESERDRLKLLLKTQQEAYDLCTMNKNRLKAELEEDKKLISKSAETVGKWRDACDLWKSKHDEAYKQSVENGKELCRWRNKAESFEKAALTYREGLVKAQDMLKESHREYSSLQAKAEKLAGALREIQKVGTIPWKDSEAVHVEHWAQTAKAALAEFEKEIK